MATNDRPKLGSAFRPGGDRTAGLSGLLPTQGPTTSSPEQVGHADEPSPAEESVKSRTPEAYADQSRLGTEETTQPRRTRTPRSGSSRPRPTGAAVRPGEASNGAGSPEDISRVVPVVLDAPVLEQLREEAKRIGQTHGLIALEAIEQHMEALATRWAPVDAPARSGLFGRTQPQHRRTEPGVQTQLRLASGDADVLEALVAQWSAPSRSALVNAALRLRLGP